MMTNYKVLNHDYENTGGNCMVSVFDVYFKTEKCTRYVFASDDCVVLATADYIRNDLSEYDYDEFVLCAVDYITNPADAAGDYLELFKYCLFEHAKKDFQHYGTTTDFYFEWLPTAYQKQITASQRHYMEEEHGDHYHTDGENVWLYYNGEGNLGEVCEVLTPYGRRRKEMLEALQQFRNGWEALRDELLTCDHFDLNDTEAIMLYPFDKSFDELEVFEWVDATISELK